MNDIIERAERCDFGSLAALWQESWRSSKRANAGTGDLGQMKSKLEGMGWDLWKIRREGEMAGFVALDLALRQVAQLFIAPRFQNSGLGRLLLDRAKSELSAGFWLRTDQANGHARRFYLREGLASDRIEDGREYYTWSPDN